LNGKQSLLVAKRMLDAWPCIQLRAEYAKSKYVKVSKARDMRWDNVALFGRCLTAKIPTRRLCTIALNLNCKAGDRASPVQQVQPPDQ